jgi:TM2 domain-containing membrane protein YozV
VSTQAPGPDGHRPGGREPDPYDATPYGGEPYGGRPYGQKPYAGDAYGYGDPNTRPYPTGTTGQGGHPRTPYPQDPQNFSAPGAHGQQGYAPGPYGQPYAPQKSRVVAGILGILLGSLGIHRFYLGFTTIGIIQILMSTVLAFLTFGLSAVAATVWGLVEGIMILVGAQQFQRDAHGVPLRD